jgi:hypothetical protein
LDEQQGPLASLWGVSYPTGYVAAILPDEDTAREAGEALTGAGFGIEDVRVHPGQEVVERHERLVQDPTVAERLLSATHADEREAMDEYIEEAREDSAFVTVRASQPDEVKRAHSVLSELSAYGMRHYDGTGLRDLD